MAIRLLIKSGKMGRAYNASDSCSLWDKRNSHDCDIEDRNLVLDADISFPREIKGLQDEILKTLDNPVAGPAFPERLSEARKIVILVDNFARLTQAFKILPPVLKKIRDAAKEMEILASGVPIYQSKARETWDYKFIGVTSYGTPISVHRHLLKADLSLAVTMTQATLWGYGGGESMILPGIMCSYETLSGITGL